MCRDCRIFRFRLLFVEVFTREFTDEAWQPCLTATTRPRDAAVDKPYRGGHRPPTYHMMAHAVVWFGSVDMPGGKTTLNAIRGMGLLNMLVIPGKGVRPSDVAAWLSPGKLKT